MGETDSQGWTDMEREREGWTVKWLERVRYGRNDSGRKRWMEREGKINKEGR